jgi:sterol desaturase/sphingolipid hydroxylase (fatty acid hydroxylase superfamily)
VELSPGIDFFLGQIGTVFLSFGSCFSLSSLACALGIAVLFVVAKRRRKDRRVRLRTIVRALFPKRIVTHASTFTDLGYLYFNLFVNGLAFGWAVLSYQYLTNGLIAGLVAAFGPAMPTALPTVLSQVAITIILFLAYEIGYWLNHWLSHRVPLMWEFHKVHHSAEVLTPVTLFRVHPIYTLIFVNIIAITTAIANGFARYMFGDTVYQYALSDTNIILVLFIHTYVHLQHTHLWIPFRGLPGHVFMSPAHHQVHHSMNSAHFNRNYGSCLALWDWMFGTLYVPAKEPEKLTFGVEPDRFPAHTITGELIAPFIRAAALFRPGRHAPARNSADLPMPQQAARIAGSK